MITEFLTIGLILLIGGILGMLISDSSYIIFLTGGICVCCSSLFEYCPSKQDVIDGKAIYQETQVITGNDTIKTYDIVWK